MSLDGKIFVSGLEMAIYTPSGSWHKQSEDLELVPSLAVDSPDLRVSLMVKTLIAMDRLNRIQEIGRAHV